MDRDACSTQTSRSIAWCNDTPLRAVIDGFASRIAQIVEIGFFRRLQAGSEQAARYSAAGAQTRADQSREWRLEGTGSRQAANERIEHHDAKTGAHRHDRAEFG